MNSQYQSRPGSSAPSSAPSNVPPAGAGGSQDMRAKAGEAASKIADVAQQAGSQAKQAASSLASDTSQKAKGFLNMQVTAGADLVGACGGICSPRRRQPRSKRAATSRPGARRG